MSVLRSLRRVPFTSDGVLLSFLNQETSVICIFFKIIAISSSFQYPVILYIMHYRLTISERMKKSST